ncbi:hypothetical protein [Vibrio parahaemolyticus]|uniref:hypothetical protein n=1 Tax=Vibrio parahaemolyticus TaxID=670 RepID=UPI0015DF11B4|nr:hypothetical protein [Vibrio parahaemolyticus]
MMTPEEIQEAVLAIVALRPTPKAKTSVSQGRLIDIKKRLCCVIRSENQTAYN